jgi:hypothetical protein
MPELKSWGERYDSSFEHSADTHCPSCFHQLLGWGKDHQLLPQGYVTFLIGFSIDCPNSGREGRIGAFIVECQGCFEKYWFHASKQQIETCKKLGKWPKD